MSKPSKASTTDDNELLVWHDRIASNQDPDVESLEQEEGYLSAFDEQVNQVFDALPNDPRQRLVALAAVYEVIRQHAAKAIQPAIAALLQEAPALDYEQKNQVSHQINQVLLDARLAIVDPETKLPAKLTTHRPRPSSAVSTLRLEDTRAGKNGRRHYLRVEELLGRGEQVELMPTVQETHHEAARSPSGSRRR